MSNSPSNTLITSSSAYQTCLQAMQSKHVVCFFLQKVPKLSKIDVACTLLPTTFFLHIYAAFVCIYNQSIPNWVAKQTFLVNETKHICVKVSTLVWSVPHLELLCLSTRTLVTAKDDNCAATWIGISSDSFTGLVSKEASF